MTTSAHFRRRWLPKSICRPVYRRRSATSGRVQVPSLRKEGLAKNDLARLTSSQRNGSIGKELPLIDFELIPSILLQDSDLGLHSCSVPLQACRPLRHCLAESSTRSAQFHHTLAWISYKQVCLGRANSLRITGAVCREPSRLTRALHDGSVQSLRMAKDAHLHRRASSPLFRQATTDLGNPNGTLLAYRTSATSTR